MAAEHLYRPSPTIHAVEDFTPALSLKIGLAQCLAMIPGVSRSGATIIGALLMDVERRTAAEFSFFLAIPTMTGAAVFDLWKGHTVLTGGDMTTIAVGFVSAFIVALLVIRWFVNFVSTRGLAAFRLVPDRFRHSHSCLASLPRRRGIGVNFRPPWPLSGLLNQEP